MCPVPEFSEDIFQKSSNLVNQIVNQSPPPIPLSNKFDLLANQNDDLEHVLDGNNVNLDHLLNSIAFISNDVED